MIPDLEVGAYRRVKGRGWIVFAVVLLAAPIFAFRAFTLVQKSEVKSLALQDVPDALKQSELIAMTYDTGFFRDLCGVAIFKLRDGVDGRGAVAQLPHVHPTPVPQGWLGNGLPTSFSCGEGIPANMKKQYLEIMSSAGSLYRHTGTKILIYTESMRMFAVLIYF
ncbi:hypothetical protein [Mesorhizobium amorphae]